MSAGSIGNDSSDQDFEINLAPIIDCFTVLITYMLVSASFISFSTLDVSVATASDQPPPEQQQPLEPAAALSVEIQAGKTLKLVLTGKTMETLPLKPNVKGEWDLESLNKSIDAYKTKYPQLSEASVKAEPTVKYKQFILVVEAIKKKLPKVVLGE